MWCSRSTTPRDIWWGICMRWRTRGSGPGAACGGQGSVGAGDAYVRHPDVRRMLVASKAYAEGGLALVLHAAKLLDEPSLSNDLLLDVLTPIVKAWPSEWCLLANDHAMQIMGGYGYTREYPIEQFYRDNRLNSIHEGTDGSPSSRWSRPRPPIRSTRGSGWLSSRMNCRASGRCWTCSSRDTLFADLDDAHLG